MEKDDRSARFSLVSLCTHDARDESSTLSRDGIRWVRKPLEKESPGFPSWKEARIFVSNLLEGSINHAF